MFYDTYTLTHTYRHTYILYPGEGVEHSREGITDKHSHNAKLF